MSDPSTAPTRRIGTRAAVRQSLESSAMADSDASSSDTSPSLSASKPSNQEPMLEPKQEPPEPQQVAPLSAEPLLSTAQITVLQVKDTVGLQPLGPSPFTGRKRKANFSNEETETLVRDVVKHFSALYGSEALRTESTRRNQRRSQLWNQIQKNVNELGYTPRTIDDLKHKWRDLRLEVKRKITHKRTLSKIVPAPGGNPVIDTKLTPLEDLVASTIGHHCTLDGEQEGMYMEPGVPRQSIFFTCRSHPGAMGDIGSDRLSATASPRPPGEISIMSPLVSTPPTQLSFVQITEDGENEDQEMDVTQTVTIKPFAESWPSVKEVCTLVTTQNLLPAQPAVVSASPELLTVKQEVLPAHTVVIPARSESQGSMVSSPEGSLGNVPGPTEWGVNGKADNPAGPGMSSNNVTMLQLKLEEEDGDSGNKTSPQEPETCNWQENQDEWERSPQPSENAPEDSMPSSCSQDGDPSSGDLVPNGECACDPDLHRRIWRANMSRLLELEENWDSMYHQEIRLWAEERKQQQQQRIHDREVQAQMLGLLKDIRDDLRQIREEKAAARLSQAASSANDSAANSASSAPAPPKPETPAAADVPVQTPRRRGRPRHIRPAPEPVRPIRPAPGHHTKS